VAPSVLFVPWVIHGSYDFFLFLGPNIHNAANVLVFLLAFAFYLFGLCYIRHLSLFVWKQDSNCGEGRTINIHQKIFDPEVSLFPASISHCFSLGSTDRASWNSSVGTFLDLCLLLLLCLQMLLPALTICAFFFELKEWSPSWGNLSSTSFSITIPTAVPTATSASADLPR
jgi:hypothetical protein